VLSRIACVTRLSIGLIVVLAAHSPAGAEILMEERDGVLYVSNAERVSSGPAGARVAAGVQQTVPDAPAAERAAEAAIRPVGVPYSALIRDTAARYAVAPELVESVIRVESNFEPRAISPKGARGLMQLMPGTAAQLGVRDAFDVRQNIEGGVRHLRDLLELYRSDVALALAAYNAGSEAVARYRGIPPYAETQAYVAKILGLLGRAVAPSPAVAHEVPKLETARPAESAADRAEAATRVVNRYEMVGGGMVYSNLSSDRLPAAVRAMLVDAQ
jgi:Transglycosylase SLT domain